MITVSLTSKAPLQPDEMPHARPEPRRILIVSATVDEEHDATGRALHEAVGRLWPKAHVQSVDILDEMSRRHRWFAKAPKRVVGAWSGRKLAPIVDRAAPDMILPTHQVATTGLEWLRHRRGLGVPTATWLPDFGGHLEAHRLEDALRALREDPPSAPPRSLRPEDAMFLHVHTAAVPQQVGTVLMFDAAADTGDTAAGQHPSRRDIAGMLRAVPGITGHLHPAGLLRRARWVPDHHVDPASLIDEVDLAEQPGDLDTVIDEFFSVPLDPAGACGQARLVTGLPDGGRAALVKLHHALGDGVTVLRALLSGTDGAHRSWATPPVPPVGPGPRSRPRRLARGLWNLARAGTAPTAPTSLPVTSAARHHQRLLLPGDQVKRTARAFEVSPSELLHAVFAEAVHRTFGSAGHGPSELRLMVPWSLRGTGSLRTAGNSAGALSADLPVGPLPPGERVGRVAAAIRTCAEGAMPEMAGAVVRSFGFLPPPLHRLASRLVYRAKWFNAIGTVLPGPRWDVRVRGVRLSAAYPVLPLAPGVGLTWGAMTWGEHVALCLTANEDLAAPAGMIAVAVREAFDEFSTAAAG